MPCFLVGQLEIFIKMVIICLDVKTNIYNYKVSTAHRNVLRYFAVRFIVAYVATYNYMFHL